VFGYVSVGIGIVESVGGFFGYVVVGEVGEVGQIGEVNFGYRGRPFALHNEGCDAKIYRGWLGMRVIRVGCW
jgi:hypothetical protein